MTDLESELLEVCDVEGFKNCPFCGTKPVFSPYGSCNSIRCEECDIGIEWQVCDIVDNWTQYDFIQTKEYCGYEKKAVLLTKTELKKAWNTRATTEREKQLVDALESIAELLEKSKRLDEDKEGVPQYHANDALIVAKQVLSQHKER